MNLSNGFVGQNHPASLPIGDVAGTDFFGRKVRKKPLFYWEHRIHFLKVVGIAYIQGATP